MSEITDKLIGIKDEIEESEKSLSLNKAKLETLMERIKEEWDCDTIEEAKALKEKMEKQIAKSKSKLKKLTDELEEAGWEL